MNALARSWAARVPWATSLAAATALGLHLAPAAASALVYDRAPIFAGELWRLWTGHWVHWGTAHLGWNLVVFVPAGVWAERLAPSRTRLFLVLAPGAISLGLLGFAPTLARYVGLSGLASGLLALFAFTRLSARAAERWFWWSVLALLVLKIGAELFADHPLFARFTDPTIRPVPLAHAAGVLVGGAIHFTPRRRP